MAAPRKDNVKDIIIDTTEKLLETQKLSAISLARIARESGISKGTLYYHYKSKDEILFDITDKYLTQQWNELIVWADNPKKDTSLDRLVKYVLERDISSMGMRLHFFYDAMLGNEEIRKKLLKRYSEFADLIAEKIGARTDKLPAAYFAWLILLVSDGLFIQETIKNEDLDTEAFIAQTAAFVKILFS